MNERELHDEERPRHRWRMWLCIAVVAVLVLRFAFHTVTHVVDLVSAVVVWAAVAALVWHFAVGVRHRRRP